MFTGPVLIDGAVREQLGDLTDLAPLHQPKSLAALDAVTAQLPGVPAVACFDTAFHTTIPPAAATYAVPREWQERYAIRRYGFHGLSHAYCSKRAAQLLGRPSPACGPSPATSARAPRWRPCSMVAASTPPWVSPRWKGWSWRPVPAPWILAWCSGSKSTNTSRRTRSPPHWSSVRAVALAGTGDMREVQAAADRGDPDARLAIDVYIHRLAGGIAAMSAATSRNRCARVHRRRRRGLSHVRRRAAAARFLGVAVDIHGNDHVAMTVTSPLPCATVRALVIARARRPADRRRGAAISAACSAGDEPASAWGDRIELLLSRGTVVGRYAHGGEPRTAGSGSGVQGRGPG